ncbi:MAG: hypothetical protein WC956_00970 [bacterium]
MNKGRIIILSFVLLAALGMFGCAGGETTLADLGTSAVSQGDEADLSEAADDASVADEGETTGDTSATTPQVTVTEVKITTSSLKKATVGKEYKKILYAKGGSCGKTICTYIWDIQDLPDGILFTDCNGNQVKTLTAASACIEGIPTKAETKTVSVIATYEGDKTKFASKELKFVVEAKTPDSGDDKDLTIIGINPLTEKFQPTTSELTVKLDNKANPQVNVRTNVDDNSYPVSLNFHAEGGCAPYTWEFHDLAKENPDRINLAEWTYTLNEKDCPGQNYCAKLSDIVPTLKDEMTDPVMDINVIVKDSCNNRASTPVKLIYKYPEDPITGVKFCMDIKEVKDVNDSYDWVPELYFWLTTAVGEKSEVTKVAWWRTILSDTTDEEIKNKEISMSTVDDPSIKITVGDGKGHKEYALAANLWGDHKERKTGQVLDADVIRMNIFTRHWYMLFDDDSNGDLINDDEESGDRDLTYGIMTSNKNGGIWVRRPVGIDNGCNIPPPPPQIAVRTQNQDPRRTEDNPCGMTDYMKKKGYICVDNSCAMTQAEIDTGSQCIDGCALTKTQIDNLTTQNIPHPWCAKL